MCRRGGASLFLRSFGLFCSNSYQEFLRSHCNLYWDEVWCEHQWQRNHACKKQNNKPVLGLFILMVWSGEGSNAVVPLQVWGNLQLGFVWAGFSLRGVLCHLSPCHTGQPRIYSQYLLYTPIWMVKKSISPSHLFCIHVHSLQPHIFWLCCL